MERESKSSQAEVDYITQENNKIIPIEVKSGTTGHLKSLHEFLMLHKTTSYALRFSAHNYSSHEKIISYPLYAVAKALNYSGLLTRKS
jgi:predicted AAA+ superfamily ATPase